MKLKFVGEFNLSLRIVKNLLQDESGRRGYCVFIGGNLIDSSGHVFHREELRDGLFDLIDDALKNLDVQMKI